MGCCQAPASCKPLECRPSAYLTQNDFSEVDPTDADIINDDAILRGSHEKINIAPSTRKDRVDEPYDVLVKESYRGSIGSIRRNQSMHIKTDASDLPDNFPPQKMDRRSHSAAKRLEKRCGQATTQLSGWHKAVEKDGDEPPLLEALGQKNFEVLEVWAFGRIIGNAW